MTSAFDIDRDQPLDALMRQWPCALRVFIRHDIHCVGCTLSPFHCLKDAAALHGVDEDRLANEIAESAERDAR